LLFQINEVDLNAISNVIRDVKDSYKDSFGYSDRFDIWTKKQMIDKVSYFTFIFYIFRLSKSHDRNSMFATNFYVDKMKPIVGFLDFQTNHDMLDRNFGDVREL